MGVRILSDRVPVTIGGEPHEMSAGDIVDYLTYCNYKHNRLIQPDITPEQWVSAYGPTAIMEARFQAETDEFFRAEWAKREKAGAL